MLRPLLTTATHLICDFDGTLTTRDIGASLCAAYRQGPEPTQLRERWLAGEISLPAFQAAVWQQVRVSPEEALGYVDRIAAFRPGVEALFARPATLKISVASGGFGFYIRHLLGERAARLSHCFANEMTLSEAGCTPHFVEEELHSAHFAVCKGRVIGRVRREEPGARVLFCGDGRSDLGAMRLRQAGNDFELCAIHNSELARACEASSTPYHAFQDFHELLTLLDDAP